MMRALPGLAVLCASGAFASLARAAPAELRVCVDVVVAAPTVPVPEAPTPPRREALGPLREDPTAAAPAGAPEPQAPVSVPPVDPEPSRDPRALSGAHLPLGQTPERYLARLLEYFVTHERGYQAVKQGCAQRVVVELYPLRLGWTAFARYTGNGREERVDQLLPTELSQFAERSVLALLHDVSINDTVDRNNVLWADSLRSTQTIHGRGHLVLGLGTRARGGRFDSAVTTVGAADFGATRRAARIVTPMLLTLGYRGQFEEFGVDANVELDLGTSQIAARENPAGGHVDFGGSTGLVLHAIRYLDVRGLSSLYLGGGASFLLHWFSVIRPEAERTPDTRSTLWGGGLDVDAVVGYEIMRASAVSFFLQGELNVPAYAVRNQNASGAVDTWFPGAALKLGAIF